VRLLERVGRGVRLTEQARILVRHTDAVLERLELAEAELAASLTEVSGTLRVASFQSVLLTLVPGALTRLADQHPRLRVEMTQREPEQAFAGLLTHDFDVVLGEEYAGEPGVTVAEVDQEDLLHDEIRLALPRRGQWSDPGTALADLAGAPWVLDPAGSPPGRWARALCRSAGFEPDVRFETADLMAHIRLIRSGNAVGLLPDLVWAGEAPSVTLVDLPGRPEREVFSSTRLAAADRPGVVACRDALARAARASAIPAGR
jgi:DNA-binding transcriptional LysR family regulator